jgi:hypothetical protein
VVLVLMSCGLLLAAVSLWQVGRLLRQSESAPARLDALVDELVATAEATTATVADRAEALGALLEAADARIATLQALGAGSGAQPQDRTVGAGTGVGFGLAAGAVTGAGWDAAALRLSAQAPSPGFGPAHSPGGTPAAGPSPSLAELVSARIAAGQEEATIARELGIARTAVRLAAQAAKTGGGR